MGECLPALLRAKYFTVRGPLPASLIRPDPAKRGESVVGSESSVV
jgi:hypothetical protein